jgi:AMP-polyphosphate phosphotransferase
MFEVAELGRTIDSDTYDAREIELRTELLDLQRALREADFPVLVLVSGFVGAGRHEVVNLLHEWLDARHVVSHAFDRPTTEEAERPEFWRYWRALPRRGQIGVYLEHWYTPAAAPDSADRAELDRALHRIVAFERALVDDGALLVKLWLHQPKQELSRRIAKLDKDKRKRWQVTPRAKEELRRYGRVRRVAERAVRITSTDGAPWTVIEATDERYRNVTVAEHLRDRLRARLEAAPKSEEGVGMPRIEDPVTVLDKIDLTPALERDEYGRKLEKWQGRLHYASRQATDEGVGAIVVVEGWDAAGKGGAIRRMLPALDATRYRVIRIAAPTEEERAHHYLWRFWRHLPRAGRVTIYDRSWYGRVLVERVEGYATEPEWQRAYREINEFEEQLFEHGIRLVKLWLHISPEEQLERFRERERVPYKRHKIRPDDWRNREKWPQYELSANEMVERTSTEYAPWTLVSAEDKRHARIQVLKTVAQALERKK